ncbi:MAG: hypothetical protein ACK4SY_02020 [Pyrobaculum sp.]
MRLPREWTIVGVLVTNLAAVLALGLPAEWWRVALVALAFFIHLTTFSPLFEEASRRRLSLPLVVLNVLPYAPALWNMPPPWVVYLVALAMVVFLTAARGRIRTPTGYVAGLALYSSLAIPMRYLLGVPAGVETLFYPLYVIYFVTFALYVESRLAFRNVDPGVPLLLWAPAVGYIAASHPPFLVAAVEPTYLLIQNYRHNVKLSAVGDIRKMGRRVLASSFLFTALAVATAKIPPAESL